MSEEGAFLFISQVYVPDPAAVGQYIAGAAAELARRGHRVVAFTSARGYDDPGRRYPAQETMDGVDVRRVGMASFGKRSLAVRMLSGLSFIFQAAAHGLAMKNLRTVVITTSPPMAAIAGLIIGLRRGVRVKYWIMDLNPDQAIAMGVLKKNAFAVRGMIWLNKKMLKRADDVIVLDRFMEARILQKVPSAKPRLTVLPPWPLDDVSPPLDHANNPFRAAHDLNGKFVVMYSGNHSLTNPLTTLLSAAEKLQDEKDLAFVFIGGGQGKKEVEASSARGVVSLPYQPIAQLRESLSAADVHVVTLGDNMIGIVHPCKVYGAMAVARPVLLFSPRENHITDMLAQQPFGRRVAHGDVDGAVAVIRELRNAPPESLREMGRKAQDVIVNRFSRDSLTKRLCDLLEGGSPGMAS